MLQKAIVSTVGFCVHYAAQIIVLALLLCLGTGFYAANPFRVGRRRQQAHIHGPALEAARGDYRKLIPIQA